MPFSKGFSLVEVLIGLLLLSMAVMTASAVLRQLHQWKHRQETYVLFYETVDSLLDELAGQTVQQAVEREASGQGNRNGLAYKYHCVPLQVSANYSFAENPTQSGNHGDFLVALQECRLQLQGGGLDRSVSFYRTVFCCPGQSSNPEEGR